MDLNVTNRLGSQQGLKLAERKEPSPDETIAVSVWAQNGHNSILYDPWCSNKLAQVVHGHYHTSWARNIFYSYQDNLFKKPARFDWTKKTVYIIGRGKSVKKNIKALNSVERENPAIFLNTSYNDAELQPCDFVMIADNRILGLDNYKGSVKSPLLSFPGIDRDIVGDNWSDLFGFVPWTRSPMNDFMREIFPKLPAVLDILCVPVMATHLALLNGAKNIVYMGMDNTHSGIHVHGTDSKGTNKRKKHPGRMKVKDIHGKPRITVKGYMEMSTAVSQLAGFARWHCKTKFHNATGAGVLGVNYFDGETLFPWINQISAWEAIKMFEG